MIQNVQIYHLHPLYPGFLKFQATKRTLDEALSFMRNWHFKGTKGVQNQIYVWAMMLLIMCTRPYPTILHWWLFKKVRSTDHVFQATIIYVILGLYCQVLFWFIDKLYLKMINGETKILPL